MIWWSFEGGVAEIKYVLSEMSEMSDLDCSVLHDVHMLLVT